MMKLLLLFISIMKVSASQLQPTPFPVFLKSGFSSVLEFEETPTRVVLGDSQNFQVEKLDRSLVIRALSAYGASNLFVYFKELEPRLFVLTASEDAQPTYYKKFENQITLKKKEPSYSPVSHKGNKLQRGLRLVSAQFDSKKDYLVIDAEITADSSGVIRPNWSLVRLLSHDHSIAPTKLWAQRKDIQKDSVVKIRLVFAKPNMSRNLEDVRLVIPLEGETQSFSLQLDGSKS